ncbi:protease modulator HflC [Roseibium limicola]|uniref:Protein HflC n=1 Tax=Roseibium limicola TaxID=2816037 RepID=A0A939EJ94_9HYPH|nr:protease modulator HflC [Roseibium limicola]MBO0343661.1 protease modulator HflC [Roseibium limicola]
MRSGFLAALVAIVAVVLYMGAFIVNPTQQALVLTFGRIDTVIQEPGLNFKWPIVQNVVYLDKRVLDLNVPTVEPNLADKKRIVVDAFARYKISDPVLFFQRVQTINAGNQRLSTFLNSAIRNELGKVSFDKIVRDDRDGVMQIIRDNVSVKAEELGIEVVDVKIRRADLPDANSQAIFARMQTERQQEATQIRAQGEEQARRIRSRADRDATVLVAEAKRDSEITRGEGDALRNRIFAEAYNADPDFFAFYRSMQAYETGLQQGETSLVLSPDSSFFRYFNDPAGTARLGAGEADAAVTAPVETGSSAAPAAQ